MELDIASRYLLICNSPKMIDDESIKILTEIGVYRKTAEIFNEIYERYEALGLYMPRVERAWEKANLIIAPTPEQKVQAQRIRALSLRDGNIYRDVKDDWDKRLKDGANVIINIIGPPGRSKSSIALGLAFESGLFENRANSQEELEKYLCWWKWEAPFKLRRLKKGECLIIDENERATGEGSKTAQERIIELEEQGRASGISIIHCAPSLEETSATTTTLEIVSSHRSSERPNGGGRALCLVWYKGIPVGNMDLPWYTKYKTLYLPLKNRHIANIFSGISSGSMKIAYATDLLCELYPGVVSAIMDLDKTDAKEITSSKVKDLKGLSEKEARLVVEHIWIAKKAVEDDSVRTAKRAVQLFEERVEAKAGEHLRQAISNAVKRKAKKSEDDD